MVFGLSFFFSSRRRHTRCLSDWSSDVCSSDLGALGGGRRTHRQPRGRESPATILVVEDDRRSEERRVGKSVDLGGRRIIKKKKTSKQAVRHTHPAVWTAAL